MRGKFEGRVALVTGGSSGIGRATALEFGRQGAKVVVADVNVEGGKETVNMIKKTGGEAMFSQTDVSKGNEVKEMVKKTVETYGRLDCAFNNAACNSSLALTGELTEESFFRTISVDLIGVWLCMKYEILYMINQGGGVIINTSSVNGLGFPSPGASEYTAVKSGLIGLSKTAQLEYAKNGIRINVVCPGVTLTPLVKKYFEAWPEREKWMLDRIPAGRFARPEEIAEAVIWLCSDSASFVYGSILPVDGGQLLS